MIAQVVQRWTALWSRLPAVVRNILLFYAAFFGVEVGSIFLLLGGFEGLAMSGIAAQLPALNLYLAPGAVVSATAALVIPAHQARVRRLAVGVVAAACAYAADVAVLFGVTRRPEQWEVDLVTSPLYWTNLMAIAAGLLFGAIARPRRSELPPVPPRDTQ